MGAGVATELEQLRDDLVRAMRRSPAIAQRVTDVLERLDVIGIMEPWDPRLVGTSMARARLRSLENLRTDYPRVFDELLLIAQEHTDAPASESVAAGRDIGIAVTGDHNQLLSAGPGFTQTAGDHVDFRNSTFHDRVVGVQHNHYGSVPAPAEWRPVGEVNPLEFGVRSTRHVPGLPDVPPYVSRDRDEDLRATLVHNGLVLILGEPYTGKSYTAWQGARSLEGRRLYAPDPGEDLRAVLAALRGQQGDYVVWLDDLTDHLGTGGLDPRSLGRLTALGAVVLGTMSSDEYYRRRAGTTPGDRVVAAARTVELAREWSEAELERLAAHDDPRAYPAYLWSGREGAASYFAVGHLLFDEWRRSGTRLEHPRGQLLVRAAVDLARCGVTGAVPGMLLRRVQEKYEAEERESYEDALAWATAPLFGVSGLLVAGEADGTWRAYGALLAEALRTGDLEPVPDEVWWTLLDAADSEGPLDHGVILGAARAALRSPIEAGDAEVMYNLAMHVEGDESESLLHRAADGGHRKAAIRVAASLLNDGDEQAALPYLEVAAEGGSSWAALNLGRIHRDRAEYWLCAAAEAGNGEAAHVLGDMLVGAEREEEAVRWYRKAAHVGRHEVAASLGRVLTHWRRPEAEAWLQYGADWGDASAENMLAIHLRRNGSSDAEVEDLFRRAVEGGDRSALINLGALLERQGQHEEARSCYIRAHREGVMFAARRMAKLLLDQGEEKEAADWFRKAAAVDPEGLPEALPPPPDRTPTDAPDTVKE